MKKTIKINLGGVVFHIDEDAYDLLRDYLDQLDARFNSQPGGSEILGDIETRMAELFQGKITADKQVLTLADATEVIDIMGEPEEIEEEIPEEQAPTYTREPGRRGRRMYRDADNQVVGGVCSGLGAYLNIDPVFVRILFVAFTLAYGVGLLLYFLLWAVIPEARTAAEKLEMFGEEVNVYNLEKKVRQQHHRSSHMGDRPGRNRSNFIGRFIRAIARIILVFFKVIGMIILGSFAIAGVAILASLIAFAIGGNSWFINADWNDGMFRLSDLFEFFVSPVGGTIGFIALLLLVCIPVLGLIYAFAKMIFRFKAPNRTIGISSFSVWVIALVVLLVVGINEAMHYSNRGQTETETALPVSAEKILVLKASPLPNLTHSDDHSYDYRDEEFRIARVGDSVCLMIEPDVRIEYTRDSVPAIRIRNSANGPSYSQAKKFASEIRYSYQMNDTTLMIDPVICLTRRDRFHAQEVEVIIELPEGRKVHLDQNLRSLLYAVDNTEETWSGDLAGDTYVMTPEGLTRLKPKQPAAQL